MALNTSGLKRGGSPGRPKGSKDRFPRSVKASIRKVMEKIARQEPKLIEQVIRDGFAGKPRDAFPYVQLFAHYLDGKPPETINVQGNKPPAPWIVVVDPTALKALPSRRDRTDA